MLDWSDDNLLSFRRNVGKERLVWIWLGKLLRREGVEPQFSVMFNRAMVQAVLLFGAKTWVLSEEITWKLEGVHLGLLRQIK